MSFKLIIKAFCISLVLIFIVNVNTVELLISGQESQEYHFHSFTDSLNNLKGSYKSFEKFNKRINYFLRRWEIQGLSIAITKDDKLVYARGFGFADTASKELMQPFHLMRIASVSKLLTATAIMKLCEENKISLGTKVFGPMGILNDEQYSHYIDQRVESITVLDLLSHKSGWTTKWGDHLFIPNAIAESLDTIPPVTAQQIIEFALSKKLHFTPGTWYSYTNISYLILGQVISKVTKMPYENYVQNSILFPLDIYNMKIGKNLYSEKYPNEVTYYVPSNADSVKSIYGDNKKVQACYGGTDITTLSSAGGWIATPAEILKLVCAIDLNPHRFDILTAESIKQMANSGLKNEALGWRGSNGKNKWWRTGSLSGSSAMIVRYNEHLNFAIITNSSSWKGSDFTLELNKLMNYIITNVQEWPERDLFTLLPNNS